MSALSVSRAAFEFGISLAMARSGPADRLLLDQPEVVAHLARMMREGLSPGPDGPEIDLRLFPELASLPLADVTSDTRIWFGDQDGSVPEAGVVALAEALPNAKLARVKGQGHFWIATKFPVVLDWLISERAPATAQTSS